MIIIAISVSLFTAVLKAFLQGNKSYLVIYGLIVPMLMLLPRIVFRADKYFEKNAKKEWIKRIERLALIIILLNIPGDLFLYDLEGIQYDRFLHFSAAALAFMLVLLVVLPHKVTRVRRVRKKIKKSGVIFLVIIILVSGLFLWEALEYGSDKLFNTKSFFDIEQSVTVDFWEDILFGFLGVAAAAMYANIYFKRYLSVLKR